MSLFLRIILKCIKLIDIGWVNMIYCFLGLALALLYDLCLGDFDKDEHGKRSLTALILDLMLHTGILGVTIYMATNIVTSIPFPLDGCFGYRHKQLPDIGCATAFTIVFLFFHRNLKQKMQHIYNQFHAELKTTTV